MTKKALARVVDGVVNEIIKAHGLNGDDKDVVLWANGKVYEYIIKNRQEILEKIS